MLTGMDIPVTAGPWLVLGMVLGVLLLLLAALYVPFGNYLASTS